MDLLVLCPFWDITISLRRPLWDKPCLPRVYFETCPLSYDNHYETRPFWDMSFFLHQPLWDMTILRHDIFPTLSIMRHDHFETWHFSYFNHYETWPFWDMKFFPHKPLWEKTILRHVFLQLHNLINKHFFSTSGAPNNQHQNNHLLDLFFEQQMQAEQSLRKVVTFVSNTLPMGVQASSILL